MGIMNIPYNQQTDPKALFARGFENMLGGIMQGRQSRRLGEALSSMDTNATPIEVAMKLLSERVSPQIAMGMGGLQQRGTQGLGVLPGWWNMATPEQRQGYLDRVGGQNINVFGNMPGYLQGKTPEQTEKNIEAYRKKQLETDETPLSEPQVSAYGEAMDARVKRVDRFRPGFKDFKEEDLFKEWQKFAGMYHFKNDSQREQIWNVWKNKVNNLGKEVDWDPTDPKWREAIGLKAESKGDKTFVTDKYPVPKNKLEFDRTLAGIEAGGNEEEADYYYDKHWKPEFGTRRQ